ncbi:hypothetical protein A33M_2757 [Rhodovulum sp. PH10]|nr:hypothetical protein A33M_2757 [Rhodovulum sp. PH10]
MNRFAIAASVEALPPDTLRRPVHRRDSDRDTPIVSTKYKRRTRNDDRPPAGRRQISAVLP